MKQCRIGLALLLGLLFFAMGVAAAEEALDVTVLCSFKGKSNSRWEQLYDRDFTSRWGGIKGDNPFIEIQLPQGRACGGLYVCFYEIPEKWVVQACREGDEWETIAEGGTAYQHAYVTFEPATHIRLRVEGKGQKIQISELFVLTEGSAPAWVQQWQPPLQKADLLVLAAHPDDELIYFGGTIPYYAVEKGKSVQVVYATTCNRVRRSEALNALWMLGVRSYPIDGAFYDAYSGTLKQAYKRWGQEKVEAWFVSVVRSVKPDVIVSHDVKGEYGHGVHQLCADLAQTVFEGAADASFYPESAETDGLWQPQKLYLHLYPNHPMKMDWKQPLTRAAYTTPLELAQQAFELHVSQQNAGGAVLKGEKFRVLDGGKYDNASYGLVKTTIGWDRARNDFFEHMDSTKPSAADALRDDALFPTPPPNSKTLLNSVSATTDTDEAAMAAIIAQSPKLNERGFLEDGEYIYEDFTLGLWLYRSQTLNITIKRKVDTAEKRVWYEAELFCDAAGGELLHTVPTDADNIGKTRLLPETTAALNKVVFGISSDYFAYRTNRSMPVGIIIRNRQVIFDQTFASDTKRFPNYDTLAFYPDGTLETNLSAAYTAEEYIAKGAYDVICFGPYLVKDGAVNPMLEEWSLGQTNQPRCSIGMVAPGHYVAILEEGRIHKQAKGTSLLRLARQMQDKGCKEALNLDGGQTAAMVFMGKRITRIGSYCGGNTSPRATSEVIGLGTSERVAP